MTIDIPTCECADKGVPEGYVCGKPGCPRVIAAEDMLAAIHGALLMKMGWEKKPMSTDATPKCRWCGQPWHAGQCPMVKALEFHPDGITIKRVEFWPTKLGPLPDKPWTGEMPEVLKPKS